MGVQGRGGKEGPVNREVLNALYCADYTAVHMQAAVSAV
jgi:hypothetical protein